MHLYKLPEEISTRRRATISLLNPPYPSFKVGTLLESWREAALDPFWRLSSKLCFCVDPSYKTRPLYSSGFFSPFRPLGSHRSRLHQVESHCMRQSPFNGTDINLFALSTTRKKPFGMLLMSIKTWTFVNLLSGSKAIKELLPQKNFNWQKQD